MKVSIIGIDLAKQVFQVAALNQAGKVVLNRKVSRAKLLDTLRGFEPGVVAMEACASAHYWGRTLQTMGFTVRLVPPQHVKAFTRVNKTDAGDAVAICEAAQRPNIHFVPLKSVQQQDIRVLFRLRDRLVHQRTATANQLRGFAAEYGVIFPKGLKLLLKQVPMALEAPDNELTPIARETLAELLRELYALSERIEHTQGRLRELTAKDPVSERLQHIPGIGPLASAAFISALGDARQFSNGRQCAAWMGLVPRMHGSGGVVRNLGITKNGDRELRTAFIHGARALLRWVGQRQDPLSRWALRVQQRQGTNKAIVALANKLARIAWAVAAKQQSFNPALAAA
jgi:transposase